MIQSRSEAIEGLMAEGLLSDGLEPQDGIDRELSQVARQQAIEDELDRMKSKALGQSDDWMLPPGTEEGEASQPEP